MKTQREIRFEITKQSFLKALKDANYKLKSEYIDCAEKVLVEPPCGHKAYWVSPANFKAGRRCQKCHIENMRVVRTIESRKRFKAKVEAEGYELKSEYINNYTKVILNPPCGHGEYPVRPYSFNNGSRCPKCATERRMEERKRLKQMKEMA